MALKDWRKVKKDAWKIKNEEIFLVIEKTKFDNTHRDVYIKTPKNWNWVILKHNSSYVQALKFAKNYMRKH
jgi:hypothetical protein